MQRLNTVLLGFVRMCFRQGRGVRALCVFPVGAASWWGRFYFLVISWTALKQVDVIWNTQSVVTHINHLKLLHLSKGSTAACYSFLSLPLYWRWWCEIVVKYFQGFVYHIAITTDIHSPYSPRVTRRSASPCLFSAFSNSTLGADPLMWADSRVLESPSSEKTFEITTSNSNLA